MTTREVLCSLSDGNGTTAQVQREVTSTGVLLWLVLDAGEQGYIPFALDSKSSHAIARGVMGVRTQSEAERFMR